MSSHDAPPLQVDEWLNTTGPLDLASLRGKVVLLHAFQMLCPGCLMHGLPQAERAHRLFGKDGVVVIGLHTVFEHHAVMGPEALRAFNHEYQWSFPIGIDRPAARGAIPLTMQAYDLRGTPSLVLLDRGGRVRLQHFGSLDDLALGAAIGRLLSEEAPRGLAAVAGQAAADDARETCDATGCPAPDGRQRR
ncbi:redoxin domain-containing protein [Achromobacter denitrificans]|jgi:thiol-disulfide isomerase/thioredoxin|uniref:Redoxin domain-containing protein n=1 Tax=Achromobacter denitrificans TaxID=32002 RepID=A0A6N0JEA2_ACHDE|nr:MULTISPECIES: redoxin domain-containing protein [Achromobacter]MBV2159581.1 redoxin domain-containing protein [Achromobacter denitrificans]MDF3857125.1 redoxin domain-containing protein [Achromobacter denitrificans]MDX3876933.1 redoxin domain-containing protein [Achromobacter sp.]MPT37963.1 redoxin domain-containing protein [Achromobacter sp.]QCS63751.1 redoxin domain-containing protein [Achromobacter denitrificans]